MYDMQSWKLASLCSPRKRMYCWLYTWTCTIMSQVHHVQACTWTIMYHEQSDTILLRCVLARPFSSQVPSLQSVHPKNELCVHFSIPICLWRLPMNVRSLCVPLDRRFGLCAASFALRSSTPSPLHQSDCWPARCGSFIARPPPPSPDRSAWSPRTALRYAIICVCTVRTWDACIYLW